MGRAPTWIKFFFENCVIFLVFYVVFMFPNVSKKKLDWVVGGWGLTRPSFSRIFGLF